MYIAVCECSFELDEYGHWNAKNVYPSINMCILTICDVSH